MPWIRAVPVLSKFCTADIFWRLGAVLWRIVRRRTMRTDMLLTILHFSSPLERKKAEVQFLHLRSSLTLYMKKALFHRSGRTNKTALENL